MFSTRVPVDRRPSRVAQAIAEARRRGAVIDLTLSNPTQAGIHYPADLLAALGDRAALAYHPAALGLRDAREAVAADYARRGVQIEADRIVLTSSTSEAYSILFKLLCDAGQSAVLTPVPSYPLFDHLTRLDGIEQQRYPLEYHGAWAVDWDGVDRAWTAATRAVLAVSPNNPTGSIVSAAEADAFMRRCAARNASLIVDEVFIDYPLGSACVARGAFDTPPCLLCRLGGLSKSVGLPQVKLGWIALDGPDDLVTEALDRLELICDTYLSVSTPVQIAARALLDRGADVRRQILDRIRTNDAALRAMAATREGASATTVLPAEGGWSAVLRVPATRTEEALVTDLAGGDGVLVHPGYFFDFPHEAFLVVSLLTEPGDFARGMKLVQDRIDAA